MNVTDPQGSKARSSGVIVRVCASSGGAPMDAAPRRDAAAASAADEEDGEETSSPPSSSLNDLGRAIVFAIPASRAARWLWSRRRGIGVAVGLAGVGPGVLGVGALRLCGVSLAVALLPLPGGWRSVQGVALLGALPGVQLPPRLASAALSLRSPALASLAAPPLLAAAAPDVARTLYMWTMFLPLYARYRLTKWRYQEVRGYSWPEIDAAWNARHEWGAVRVHDMLLKLSGYYVKSAQVLASKGDFIPIQWVVPLTAMFDAMPPRPWRAVRADLDADVASTPLGRELAAERARERVGGSGRHAARVRAADVFSSIDTTPLATASIAQVHAAELSAATVARLGWRWKGGGGGNGGRGTPTSSRRVVLKIQNEGMRALMDSDCRNLQRLASFVGDIMPFDVVGLLSEMRQTVPKEFDFLREARLQAVMGGRLAADGHGHIVVPRPCAGLTTRRLLVMERLDGVSLAAVIRGEGESGSGSGGGSGAPPSGPSVATLARARAAVAALVDAYGPMLFGHGLFHADPHAGNVMLLRQEAPDGRSGGEGGGLAGGAASTSSSSGRLWPFPSSSTRATPPPPRMALLDFGQVKALAAPRRVGLARLVLAMDEGLPEPILDALIAMGLNPEATAVDGTGAPGDASPRRGPDPLLASVLAAVVFDTAPLPAAAVNPLDETGRSVLKLAPVRAFPPDLFQVGRTIMILRGLCHAVGADVSATTLWRPWAVRALADAAPLARALQNKAWDNGDDHPDEDAGLVWGVEVREG